MSPSSVVFVVVVIVGIDGVALTIFNHEDFGEELTEEAEEAEELLITLASPSFPFFSSFNVEVFVFKEE